MQSDVLHLLVNKQSTPQDQWVGKIPKMRVNAWRLCVEEAGKGAFSRQPFSGSTAFRNSGRSTAQNEITPRLHRVFLTSGLGAVRRQSRVHLMVRIVIINESVPVAVGNLSRDPTLLVLRIVLKAASVQG